MIQYIKLFTIFTKLFSLRALLLLLSVTLLGLRCCFWRSMCYELRCAFARLFFAGPVRLTRYWCCRVPRYSLLVCAVRVVCCFVFRPGHELCRVMSALLRALQCCVLRPVVLPVALAGGVTYCPAVSLLRSAVCELVALCGVSSCPVPCSDLCALLCDFVPARFLRGVCVHAPWHVRGSVRCARVPPWL
jgi:hypothetical protein